MTTLERITKINEVIGYTYYHSFYSDDGTTYEWRIHTSTDVLADRFKKDLKEHLAIIQKGFPANFKEWLFLLEMPHVRILNCGSGVKINGYTVCAIDFKFEDWDEFMLGLNRSTPFIAKTNDNRWLIYHGGFANPDIEYSFQRPKTNYKILPKEWSKYAEFYDDDYNVVKPAFKDAIARLS